MKKRLAALLLALAMLLSLLTGCGGGDSEESTDTSGEAETSESGDTDGETTEGEESTLTQVPDEARQDPVSYLTDGALAPEDVALTVGGREVSAAEYLYWLAYQYTYAAYNYSMYGMTLDVTEAADEEGNTIAYALGQQAQNQAAMYSVLTAKAEEAGLSLSEEQEAQMADLASNYDENSLLYYATDLDTFQATYVQTCQAMNLQDHLFAEGGEQAPTEATLQSYAQDNEVYTCRYILLNTQELEEDDTEGRQAQLDRAQEIYDDLSQCSPEELESKFQEYQSSDNYDGNTEPFTYDVNDSMVAGFKEKVAELEVGQLGLTDETDYGYFVVLRLETDLETVKEDYQTDTYNNLISQWMEEADVTASDGLNNLDYVAVLEKLIALQDAIYSETSAAGEESTETVEEDSSNTTNADAVG